MKGTSIGAKISAVTCGATLLLVGALTAYFVTAQTRSLQENLDDDAIGTSALLARAVAPAVAFDDRETARELFDATMQDENVTGLALYGAGGKLIYAAGESGDPPTKEFARVAIQREEDDERVFSPVVSAEGPRGTLVLRIGKEDLRRHRAQSLRAAVVAALAAMVLGFAFAWLLGRSLGRRLRAIATATRAVAAGDLDRTDLRDPSTDEIGQLAAGFNTMAGNIRSMVAQIKSTAATERERLDMLVKERTSQLDARNRDMRLVLDNVGEGFLTVDPNGNVSEERSAITEEWLGPLPHDGTLPSWIGGLDSKVGDWLQMGLDAIAADTLPMELLLDQMPKKLDQDGRTLSFAYRPIPAAGPLERLLVVISDTTSEEAQRRSEQAQRELLSFVERFMRDREGMLDFVAEAGSIVGRVTAGEPVLSADTRRGIHTLKGTAAMFGVQTVADACQEIENELAERAEPLNESQRERLQTAWKSFLSRVGVLVDRDRDVLRVGDAAVDTLTAHISSGAPRSELLREIAGWRLEPASVPLSRFAEQARSVATRIGKPEVAVRIDAPEDLRLPPHRWAAFWSAFTHVIRNAVDHGIESEEERLVAGKSPNGTIVLSARREGAAIAIEASDDGRGVDRSSVVARARSLGLAPETMSLLELMAADGLSTKSEATDISGRGVGLGAVLAECTKLGGRASLATTPGGGSTFRFVIPDVQLPVARVSRKSFPAVAG